MKFHCLWPNTTHINNSVSEREMRDPSLQLKLCLTLYIHISHTHTLPLKWPFCPSLSAFIFFFSFDSTTPPLSLSHREILSLSTPQWTPAKPSPTIRIGPIPPPTQLRPPREQGTSSCRRLSSRSPAPRASRFRRGSVRRRFSSRRCCSPTWRLVLSSQWLPSIFF